MHYLWKCNQSLDDFRFLK